MPILLQIMYFSIASVKSVKHLIVVEPKGSESVYIERSLIAIDTFTLTTSLNPYVDSGNVRVGK